METAGPAANAAHIFEWVSLYALAAVLAINAAYLALRGNGAHIVSLNTVIETLRQTGEISGPKIRKRVWAGWW